MMIKKTVFGLAVVTVIMATPYAGAALTGDEARAAGFVYGAKNRTVTITGYTGEAADVAIPNGIDGLPVTAIGAEAFFGCESLTSVTIPDSVTSIGAGAFYECESLASVTIPDSVTRIGEEAFWNCADLASVTIPASVTAIGAGAFSGCASLGTISVSSANRQYKSVDGVLFTQNGTMLHSYPAGSTRTAYAIPDGVTRIGAGAFYNCFGLASVTIPDGVTGIGKNAFAYCVGLVSVTIPEGVTRIDERAFLYCKSLVSVTIPGSVTRIGAEAFYQCPLNRFTRTDIERRFGSGQRTP